MYTKERALKDYTAELEHIENHIVKEGEKPEFIRARRQLKQDIEDIKSGTVEGVAITDYSIFNY